MGERDRDRERRLREAQLAKVTRQAPEPADPDQHDAEGVPEDAEDPGYDRVEQQALWVDHQIRAAMERGEFDDLPGAGKPLRLPDRHDPDWWVKGLVERERISGVLPPALALRTENAELDDALDGESSEVEVRRLVADFNARVVDARRQLLGGPPVITATRDADAEVAAWRERRGRSGARRPDPGDGAPRDPDTAGPRGRGLRRWFRRH